MQGAMTWAAGAATSTDALALDVFKASMTFIWDNGGSVSHQAETSIQPYQTLGGLSCIRNEVYYRRLADFVGVCLICGCLHRVPAS